MDLKSKHKVDPAFNMSSMTDVVFLLLVFFMLTSTFITPSALPVSTPSKNESSKAAAKKVQLEITKDLRYYVDGKETSYSRLKESLAKKISISNTDKDIVIVKADKKVKYNEVMKVAGLAAELNVKISLAQNN